MPIHDWTRVNAGIFHDFHLSWIDQLKRALNSGLLPVDYYALAEQVAGGLEPDVITLKELPSPRAGPGPAKEPCGGIAVMTAPPKVRFTAQAELEHYARKRKTLTIRHSSDDRVIAMLELVSPGNKSSRAGLRAFVSKAAEFLEGGIHLLVVDLFPPTRRDPQGIHDAIWGELTDSEFQLPADKRLTLVAYSAGPVKQAYIEPVAAGEALPDMPLFLTPEVYVAVPLEATYQRAWEAVPRRWREVLEPQV
jgi:hypothetical protein